MLRLFQRFKRKAHPKPQAPALTLAQSWWLFAAAIAALTPLVQHIPAWLTASAAVGMAWRAWLIWRSGRLPPRWLLFLLVVAGCAAVAYSYRGFFGRNPGLALLVIFMTLKLLELRSARDGITVILLACFLLMSGFFFNQSISAALLALVALIVVIAALISLQPGPRLSIRKQLQQSALLLAQALPFMLVLFLLFPRVQGPLWGLPQDAFGASSGLSESMAPGSISQVAQSDAIAFRVRFKDETPPPQQQYWRALTLSNYDGINWSYRPTPERPELPYTPEGKVVDYEVTLEPHNQRWLMALEKPGKLPPDSSFSGDGLVLSNTPVRSRLRYEMQAYPDFQPAAEENSQRLSAALRLPPEVNPRTRALAEQWRQQYASDTEILQATAEFFQKQLLAYTLTPPLMRENAVDAFLFDHKRGFCEHFASAYAFALRAAGVPARVIGGYQGGEVNPVDGYFTVRQYDAHVWVEAWVKNRGWVRIDPTADSAPRRIDGGLRTAVSGEEAPLLARQNYAWLREIRYRLDAVTNAWNQAVLGFNPQRQREVLNKLGMSEPDWKKMTAWLAGLCGLLILGLVLYAMRERTRGDIVTRLWRDFLLRLERKGVQPHHWMGPDTLAQQAAAQLPQHAAAIHAITAAYVALRYADELTPEQRAQQTATLRDSITRFRP
jgi:transglutaminase-like putative cysteine protease